MFFLWTLNLVRKFNKDYFIPIYFDGVEYNSIQDLVMTKNGININGVSVWKMGKISMSQYMFVMNYIGLELWILI